MAGRPLRRALAAELERRARLHFEDGDLPADERRPVLDFILDWVADGNTQLQLAHDVTKATGLPITSQQVGRYIRELAPNAAERVQAARQTGAHSMVDQAIDIVDSAPADRDAVRKAQAQANVRTWVAERWNRKDLGAPKGPAIQVSINTMHLDALRRRAATATITAGEGAGDVAHARLIRGGGIEHLEEIEVEELPTDS